MELEPACANRATGNIGTASSLAECAAEQAGLTARLVERECRRMNTRAEWEWVGDEGAGDVTLSSRAAPPHT